MARALKTAGAHFSGASPVASALGLHDCVRRLRPDGSVSLGCSVNDGAKTTGREVEGTNVANEQPCGRMMAKRRGLAFESREIPRQHDCRSVQVKTLTGPNHTFEKPATEETCSAGRIQILRRKTLRWGNLRHESQLASSLSLSHMENTQQLSRQTAPAVTKEDVDRSSEGAPSLLKLLICRR